MTEAQSVVPIPEDLNTRYRLAKAQLGLLPPVPAEDEDEYAGLRFQCEEVIELIERIGAREKENAQVKEAAATNARLLDRLYPEKHALESALATANAQVATWTAQSEQYRRRVGELEGKIERLKDDFIHATAGKDKQLLEYHLAVNNMGAELARLKQPVNDEEWLGLCAGDHVQFTDMQRSDIDRFLEFRSSSEARADKEKENL